MPQRIPVRIIESHSQNGDRTLDKRSVEIRGTDGHFEPYQDIETATLVVDASTVRTTTRTFGRDVNGKKALVQLTEEEKHVLSGGESSLVRKTYNPDVNGKLQPVQREEVGTRTNGKDLEETDSKVMLPGVDGGLAPAFKTHELRKRAENDTVETEKTTWLPDVNGKWQLSEIRQNVTTQEATDRRIEEKVFRPDAEGKLGQISRVVSRESESTTGEKLNSVESYSVDVPGTSGDGILHLVERKITTGHSSSTGERTSDQTVEQINPGDPGSGLRVSVLVNGKMVPGPSGEESTVTIRVRDSNDNFGVVSVDTTKSDRTPPFRFSKRLLKSRNKAITTYFGHIEIGREARRLCGLLPELGQCPWQVIPVSGARFRDPLVLRHLQVFTFGSQIANTISDLQRSNTWPMLGELTNIPTDTLINMLFVILACKLAVTPNDSAEIEQIQRELQRRREEQNWSFRTIN